MRLSPVRRILYGLVVVAAMTGVAKALDVDLAVASLLLLAAVIVASLFGLPAALVSAAAAFISLNVLFTEPTGSLRIQRSDDVAALVVFAVTAIVLGWLVRTLTSATERLRRDEREARLRLELTTELLHGDTLDETLPTTVSTLREVFDLDGCALHVDGRAYASGHVDGTAQLSFAAGSVHLDVYAGDDLDGGDRALLEALIAGLAASVDRIRLQEEVRETRLVAELGRQRAGFLSAVSHNLRTPLTAVKAAAGTLLSSWSRIEPEERRELLETISDEAERLERLVRNTLELSRIRAGALEFEPEPADIGGLVQHAVRRLRPIARAHRVRLDVDDDLPEVMLDVTMVEQIMLNLLENALKYAPPGSEIVVSARPVLDAATGGTVVELRVSDHGPGVPAGAQDRIFEEFQSAEARPDSAGTGLGLAIVRALMLAHGGTARYEDTPGGGATFVCTFPLGKGAMETRA